MKLNIDQLNHIDTILEDYGLDFLDFKLEIKDHIATQIEELCKEQELSFEQSLQIALEQWKPQLKLTESLWISNKRSFPRIVNNALQKRYIIYNCITLVLVIFLYGLDIFKLNKSEIQPIYMFASLGTLWLIFSYLCYSIYRSGLKTSFSYEFNRFYKLFSMMLGFGGLFLLISNTIIIWSLVILSYMPIGLYSYFKHKKFEKQYKLV